MDRRRRSPLLLAAVLFFFSAAGPAWGGTLEISGPETPALVISGKDVSRGQGFLHNYVALSPAELESVAVSASGEATYSLGLGDCFTEALLYSTYEDHGTPAWIYRRVCGLDLRELAAALGIDPGRAVSVSVYASDDMSKTLPDAFGVNTRRWYYDLSGQRVQEVGPILALFQTTSETQELAAGSLPPLPQLAADSPDRVDNVFGYGQTSITEINSCYWVKNVRRLRFGAEDPALSVSDESGAVTDVSLSTLISRGQWRAALGTVKVWGVPLEQLLRDMGLSLSPGHVLRAQSAGGAYRDLTGSELASSFAAWKATDNGSAVANATALRLYCGDGSVLPDLVSLRLVKEGAAPPGPLGPVFSDLGDHAWAEQAIRFLAAQGMVKGLTAESFGPALPIKRGDFMLMLARAYDLQAADQGNFSDVPAGSYYYDAIAAAKSLSVARGDGRNFQPEASITRQEALALMERTVAAVGCELRGPAADISGFRDYALVAEWARTPVSVLVGAEVIQGSNNRLDPLGELTRAEMAVALHKLLSL